MRWILHTSRARVPASGIMGGGDVVYDIQNQIIDPIYQVLDYEPHSTGNQCRSKRQERGAIEKALNSGTFLLPIHDDPARIEHGRVVSRFVSDSVPGHELAVEHRTVAETRKMGLGREEFRLPPAP